MIKKNFLLCFLFLFSCKSFVTTTVGVAEKSTRTIRTADQIRIDSDLEQQLNNIVDSEFAGSTEYCGFNAMNGHILVACIVKNEYTKKQILERVATMKNVEKIYDEITVDSLLKRKTFQDYSIRKLIDSKFLFKSSIKSLNYEFTVINGIVYMIGIPSQKEEIENVAKSIATIRGVKGVVSYNVNDDNQ